MALQADGKILVGGYMAAEQRMGIIRLNSDGTQDPAFFADIDYASYGLLSLMQQANGKILVGGGFTMLCGQPRQNLGRLNSDGTIDPTFIPGANSDNYGFDPYVSCFALVPDGRIVVGGSFTMLGGQPRLNLGRLVADNQGALVRITTANPLPAGTVGCEYSQPLTASGGTAPYLWSIANGNLPEGLELRADGVISGTPTYGGGGSIFTVGVTDINGWSSTKEFVLTTGELWFWDNPSPVPWGFVGRAYDQSLSVSRGAAPYTWTIASGRLPAGLLMSGDGHITGTPLALGTYTFTVRVVDRDGIWGQQEFSIAVLTGSDLQDLRCVVPLVPTFDPATTRYSVNWVGSQFNFGATLATPDATMQVRLNGGTYEMWDADWNIYGHAFPLNIGSNTLDLKVTASDGVTSKTYTLAVTRTVSTKLVDFWVSNGEVTPTFNPETNAYRTGLPNDYTELLAWAEDNSATLALRINGGTYESLGTDEMYRQIALAMGDNVIDVRVTAADASTRTYTLIATRTHGIICDGFNPGLEGGDRSRWRVNTMTVQADGKILAGGNFTTLGGLPRNHIGRLNSNGTLDATFNPGISTAQGDQVFALAVQADGNILVSGEFTSLAGQARAYLGRLNADGSLDSSFTPVTDGRVNSLAIQPDGKILIGGSFQTLNGESCAGLGRLNPNGLLDITFTTSPPYEGQVSALALQADGKILVLGDTTLYRLNTDGSLDTEFQKHSLSSYAWVRCLALQTDGKILIGWLSNNQNYRIERLNSDGSEDSSFAAGVSTESSYDYGVIALMPQADGKILVGGKFTTLSGQARQNLGRLNANGTADTTFNPGISNGFSDCYVSCFALQPEGQIVVGGSFTMLGGQPRQNIARLMADEQGSPVIITSISTLPAGLTSVPYTGYLTASGGSLPYNWSIPNGNLPDGLNLGVSGGITGTPVSSKTATFTARATDTLGRFAEQQFTLTISGSPVVLSAYETWKRNYFTNPADLADPAISGENGDPDHDGIPNLLEYGLGLLPGTTDTSGLPTAEVQSGYLTLTYRHNKQATDLLYMVEACGDIAGGKWSSIGVVESTRVDKGDYWSITVRDAVPTSSESHRFMRLKVVIADSAYTP